MFQRDTLLLTALFLLASTALFSQTPTLLVQVKTTPHREPVNILPGQTKLQICGLVPGNTYQVLALPAFAGVKARYELRLAEAPQEATAKKLSSADRPQLRRFVATSSCTQFTLETSTDIQAEVPSFISIGCLDCKSEDLQKKQFVQNLAEAANLNVTQGETADDLVTNVLIGGDCFDVSGIASTGEADGRGTFTNGSSSINISEGIVLATARTSILPGPNLIPNANGGFAVNSIDDPDLATLTAGINQFDVAIIEFDFKPTANFVQFDFVFGSEEYCEYVNTIYNDVFGFFISGPGITGTQNLAVIPGTNTPVAVNEVNHLKNSNYYHNNNSYSTCSNVAVTNLNDIELDGFTTVLTAEANVIPCETYHIKLAIADVGDANYTSAVFLRANSFDAGGKALATPIYPSTEPYTQEGCKDGYIRFYRGTGDINLPLTVNYTIDPASTATPGLDFEPLPASIVIPAGQTELLIPVNVIDDQLQEGSEFFTLLLDNSCSCQQQDITFVIEDQVPLDLSMSDETGCVGSATLSPVLNAGGLAPLSYLWNTGQTSSSLTSTNFGSTIYTVTVTDVCGLTATAAASATVDQTPTAVLSGDANFCHGSSGQLQLNFTGFGPWITTINANGTPITQTFSSNPATLEVDQAGSYLLTAVSSQGGCPGLASGVGTATEVDIELSLDETQPPCFGDPGVITTSVNPALQPYSYAWSTGATSANLSNALAGDYSVTVSAAQGCTAVQTTTLLEPALLTTNVINSSRIDCYNPIGTAEIETRGGTGVYQINWSNGAQQALANFNSGGTYSVTVTDENFCTAFTEVSIVQNTTPPTVSTTAMDEITCNNPEVKLISLGSSTGANIVYSWSTLDGHFITSMEEPSAMVDASGTYTLLVTNTENGCTASDQTIVLENTNYPTALDLQMVQPGCDNAPGAVHILEVQGGEAPYVFSLDGGNTFLNQSSFIDITAGQYDLVVQDINGCEYAQNLSFVGPIEPSLSIQPEFTLNYGENAEITAMLNLPLNQLDTLIWSPLEGITGTNLPNVVIARPFQTTLYSVTAISKDGCADVAEVLVKVGNPDIYAPNAIRPSSTDGQNHVFMLFARDQAVNQINQLQIFDRWGNLLFGRDHFQPNDAQAGGWDGRFEGKLLGPGVFTWWADVELASGAQIQLKGDVTIVD